MSSLPKKHWPEYAMEAAGLGAFMISACSFGTLLEHPSSPVRRAIDDDFARRALMGVLMGLTAIAITYSPWGQRSGAHINPSVTLAFLRLGRVRGRDAVYYVAAQTVGATLGVLLSFLFLGHWLAHPTTNFVVTLPGPRGELVAFVAELVISGVLFAVVLVVSASRWAKLTGIVAGGIVAAYVTFEAPLSGMSMNPARTFASAAVAGEWRSIWIYFVAPPLAMLAVAEIFRRAGARGCAKIVHSLKRPCIHCGYRPSA